MSLNSQIKQWAVKSLPGMNNKGEPEELQDEALDQAVGGQDSDIPEAEKPEAGPAEPSHPAEKPTRL